MSIISQSQIWHYHKIVVRYFGLRLKFNTSVSAKDKVTQGIRRILVSWDNAPLPPEAKKI